MPGVNPGIRLLVVDPQNRDHPHKVWMGIQPCGVKNKVVAKNLARILFMNDFVRCLKVAKQDVRDTFESLEKRSENNATVGLHTKDLVVAFHHWVKTCF